MLIVKRGSTTIKCGRRRNNCPSVVLYTFSNDSYWLLGVQLPDGVGAGLYRAAPAGVVADLMAKHRCVFIDDGCGTHRGLR
jgi:hypothetical protein